MEKIYVDCECYLGGFYALHVCYLMIDISKYLTKRLFAMTGRE